MSYRIISVLLFIVVNIVSAQCDYNSELSCNLNEDCEWIEDIAYGSCSEFNQNSSACESMSGCYGAYQYPGWYSGWYCAGGNYQIDNSYCQEIEMLECSEMQEQECSSSDSCDWIENVDSGYCSDFDYNSGSCNSIDQCNWTSYQIDCGTGTGYSDCVSQSGCSYSWLTYTCSGLTTVSDCSGGYYEIDNGFCQENPECSGMNEQQCFNDSSCMWVEDFEMEICTFEYANTCNSVPGCNWDCDSWYTWLCGCEGYYQVEYNYCEENQYQLGDISQDSVINIQDVIMTISLILNNEFNYLADMNNDNILNVIDILQMVNIIIGID